MFAKFRRLSATLQWIENVLYFSQTTASRTIHLTPRMIEVVQPTRVLQNQNDPKSLQLARRYKSKGDKSQKKRATESESEDKSEDGIDSIQDKNTKTLKVSVTSMRMDGIIKAGLGLSRNKVDLIFYESKIRLNGEKVLKKSAHIKEGDEIDIIKGVNVNNPSFLQISRIEVVSVIPEEESISVKMRRFKSIIVENYEGRNEWKL